MTKQLPYKTYRFKIINIKQEYTSYFKDIIIKASQQLLSKIWSEEWIEKLGKNKNLKAHTIVNAKNVKLTKEGIDYYIPSRIRRGIAEYIGRMLRSHYKNRNCFYDCLKIVETAGLDTSDSRLYRLIRLNYCNKSWKPNYKKTMVMKIISLIRKWDKLLKLDLTTISYCSIISPKISNFKFLYSCDDGQALVYNIFDTQIAFRIKLPIVPQPQYQKNWKWFDGKIDIPIKIQRKIQNADNRQPKKPFLTTQILKGDKEYFFLVFPWSFTNLKRKVRYTTERMISVDLGIRKLAVCVVCEKGKQVSRPIFIKQTSKVTREIERLYRHLSGIESKLRKKKNRRLDDSEHFEQLSTEYERLNRKLKRTREHFVHAFCNSLIAIVKQWNCSTILLEDLRIYKAKKGSGRTSRLKAEWLRGKVNHTLKYKSQIDGINIQTVSPFFTSTHCARCGYKYGFKVKGPNNLQKDKTGRWFHCTSCGFLADRDYNAALNIYRAREIDYVEIKSLVQTQPIPNPYMELGTPLNHPSGGPEMIHDKLFIVVTGG